MKKVLYSTTALAAAGLLAFSPADAQAAEKLKLGLSGSFTWLAGTADNGNEKIDDASSAINMVADSEVHFKGSTKLDNGVSVAVVIELETDHANANSGVQTTTGTVQDSDGSNVNVGGNPQTYVASAKGTGGLVIDESYIKVGDSKAWGEFRLGTTKNAAFIAGRTPPPVSGIINGLTPDPGAFFLPTTTGTPAHYWHEGGYDHMLAAYYTPNVNGFQGGFSFTPGTANSNGLPQTEGDAPADTDITSLGVKYGGKFGDAGIAISAGHTQANGKLEYTSTQFGVKVSFAGFSVGGHWSEREDDRSNMTALDREGFAAGVGYKTGPWNVALTWMNAVDDTSATLAGEDESNLYSLGVTYALGAGVTAGANVITADYDDESGVETAENDGTAFVGGIKVAF